MSHRNTCAAPRPRGLWKKKLSVAAGVAGLLAVPLLGGALLRQDDEPGLIKVDMGSCHSAIQCDKVALQILSRDLQRNPQAPGAQVDWALHNTAKGTLACRLAYSRATKVLRERSIYTSDDQQYVYSNLTEAAIAQVAQRNRPAYELKYSGATLRSELSLLRQLRMRLRNVLRF